MEKLKTFYRENQKTVIGIVLLVVMVIGFSYAWFQLTLRGEKENVLKAGTLSLILDDTMGDGISIENGVPVTDEDGLKTVPYTFTLENNGTLDSDYTIYLDDLDLLEGETRMSDGAIKYYLTKDGSDLGLDLLSATGENPNRVLDSGVIAPGEKYTYTLRLWIADTATNEVMGTTFRGQVRIEAIQAASKAFAVYSEDDKSLRFYNRTSIPNVGETYEELTATAVYTGIEQLEATTASEIPWSSYANGIEKVVVADEISPTSTAYWFYNAGFNATTFEMDLSKLDTSNVTNMSSMFCRTGFSAATFEVDLSNLDTSNVTNMSSMFSETGRNATTFELNLSNWNTSNVTNMRAMFSATGQYATTWSIGNLSDWDTSSVSYMNYMFSEAGYSATTWSIGDIGKWNTSNVTNMRAMFSATGVNATTWSVGDISNWDTSNATNMSGMFERVGVNATTWSVGDLSNWNTSNVTDMSRMFYNAGFNATYTLDLSSWNVSNVTSHDNFNYNVESKVIAPTWVN